MKLLLHPLAIRVFHWIMFTCVMGLLITGKYLSSPVIYQSTRLVRSIHLFLGMSLLLNFVFHVYYYVYTKKYSEVLFLPKDFSNLRSFFQYYLFIKPDHPNYGRYNPGQKFIYSSWGAVFIILGITGMALAFPDFTAVQKIMGGLHTIRVIHYFAGIYFAATVPIHIYLVFTEDPAKLQAIFTGYIKVTPKQEKEKTEDEYSDV